MTRKSRPAKLTIRPTIKGYSVVRHGRVICRTNDKRAAEAFIEGWREAEAERAAEQAQTPD